MQKIVYKYEERSNVSLINLINKKQENEEIKRSLQKAFSSGQSSNRFAEHLAPEPTLYFAGPYAKPI